MRKFFYRLVLVTTVLFSALGCEHTPRLPETTFLSNKGDRYAITIRFRKHTAQNDIFTGFGPMDLRKIYDSQNPNLLGDGSTICLVEAFDNKQSLADSQVYATRFDLPTPNVNLVEVTGSAKQDTVGWHAETTLDIDMVMAIAPHAKIIVLEAEDDAESSMQTAIAAVPKQGCDVVSMSFGGPAAFNEAQTQNLYEIPGVAFFASSGDFSGVPEYPSLQPGVVAVGGTTIKIDGDEISETIWNDASGSGSGEGVGISDLFALPSYQAGFNPRPFKQSPEVTAVADPNTGVAVYNDGKWDVVGGTSAASPIWAAVTALVYQSRRQNQLPVIEDFHQAIYLGLASKEDSTFRDVVSGCIEKTCASPGYDAVSGFGSPITQAIVSYLE